MPTPMDPLTGEKYVNLATFRKSGRAIETAVWFAALDGRYYVFSEAGAGKVKRLRNSPRARVAACGSRGDLRGAWLDAEAFIVEDGDVEKRAYAVLREKYGWQMRLINLVSRLSGRIDKRVLLEIRLVSPAAPTNLRAARSNSSDSGEDRATGGGSHLVAGGNHAVDQTERQGFFCSEPIVAVDSHLDFLIGFAGGLAVDIDDEIPGFEDFIGLDFKIRGPPLIAG